MKERERRGEEGEGTYMDERMCLRLNEKNLRKERQKVVGKKKGEKKKTKNNEQINNLLLFFF